MGPLALIILDVRESVEREVLGLARSLHMATTPPAVPLLCIPALQRARARIPSTVGELWCVSGMNGP